MVSFQDHMHIRNVKSLRNSNIVDLFPTMEIISFIKDRKVIDISIDHYSDRTTMESNE